MSLLRARRYRRISQLSTYNATYVRGRFNYYFHCHGFLWKLIFHLIAISFYLVAHCHQNVSFSSNSELIKSFIPFFFFFWPGKLIVIAPELI